MTALRAKDISDGCPQYLDLPTMRGREDILCNPIVLRFVFRWQVGDRGRLQQEKTSA